MKSLDAINLLSFVLIVSLTNEVASLPKPMKKLLKNTKDFFKGIIKESKNAPIEEDIYEEYPPVYAVPAPDGYGYVIHGYNPHASQYPQDDHYDEGLDIYEIPKAWSGKLSIPNVFKSHETSGYSSSNTLIQGLDNRLGFRIAIPYFGDFQYIREIGPGKYTDKLGPGKFTYPGLNEKKKKKHMASYGHTADGYTSSDYDEAYGIAEVDAHSSAYDSYGKPKYGQEEEEEVMDDPLASLKNYPWYRR